MSPQADGKIEISKPTGSRLTIIELSINCVGVGIGFSKQFTFSLMQQYNPHQLLYDYLKHILASQSLFI